MNITDIRTIARNHGLKIGGSSKLDLIHAIQREEGNFDCFASATSQYCDQFTCQWREDCFESAKKKSS
jgi:hypothetical protein